MTESSVLKAYAAHPRTPEFAAQRFGHLDPALEWSADDGTYYLNMGPQHPSMHGVLRLLLRLDGERVVECRPVIGYSHRAHEKMAERGQYVQFMPNPSRMDYLGGMIYNVAYCELVERSFGIDVPERAQVIRVLVSELNRVASHLLWFGTFVMDLGGITPFLLAFQDRENVLDILDSVSGSRLTYSYARFGGVMRDLTPDFAERTRAFIEVQRRHLLRYDTLVTGNAIFRNRCEGVGVITAEQVQHYGITGPIARAAGIDYDLRKAEPWGFYRAVEFEVPTRSAGDCMARYELRLAEIEQSLRIVEQCLDALPAGPVGPDKPLVKVKPVPGTYYHAAESPRGQLGFFLVADGNQEPWRLHARTPSFANLSAMEEVLVGSMVADTIAILGSIDIVMPEVDR
jgi:NADH-quinone oxidoreductase subunit D